MNLSGAFVMMHDLVSPCQRRSNRFTSFVTVPTSRVAGFSRPLRPLRLVGREDSSPPGSHVDLGQPAGPVPSSGTRFKIFDRPMGADALISGGTCGANPPAAESAAMIGLLSFSFTSSVRCCCGGRSVSRVAASAATADHSLWESIDNPVDEEPQRRLRSVPARANASGDGVHEGVVPRGGTRFKISARPAGAKAPIVGSRPLSTGIPSDGRRMTDESRVQSTGPRSVRSGVYTRPMTKAGSAGGGLQRCLRFLLDERPLAVRRGVRSSGWDCHPQGAVVGDEEHSLRMEGMKRVAGVVLRDARGLGELGGQGCVLEDQVELSGGAQRDVRTVEIAVVQHHAHGGGLAGFGPERVGDFGHHFVVRADRTVPVLVEGAGRLQVVQGLGLPGAWGPRCAGADSLRGGGSASGLPGAAFCGIRFFACHGLCNDGPCNKFPFLQLARVGW